MRRVVVTGMGIVCPLGLQIEPVWQNLLNGVSGISAVTHLGLELPSRVAGQVAAAWTHGPGLVAGGRVSQLALLAAQEAFVDAGWNWHDEATQAMSGISVGSGCGGIEILSKGITDIGTACSSFLPRGMIHQVATDLAHAFALHGPRRSVSTACCSGAHAIGDAARLIAMGDADVMLAGGAEAAVHELGLGGFAAARALSTAFNDAPYRACRPWDQDRDGFVMGEGAGMVVLESLEHARARDAWPYAEVVGYGMAGDAGHIAAPSEVGDGAFRAMDRALRSARMAPEDIQYVNAHATSTPVGDDVELAAVERLFGPASRRLAMSSTKSATSHLLGAAGAVEAIFSILAIRDGAAPPTLNLDVPSRASVIDRVAHQAQERVISAAMSNSFGFGGVNVSLVFRTV